MSLRVVCVKHGDKYPSYYVNRLRNMVTRHLDLNHEFICFTEKPEGIDAGITVKQLGDYPLSGWWWKPYLFRPGTFDDGDTVLFFDLDMIIVNDISKFVDYLPGRFLGLRDVGRVFSKQRQKLGSAVMRWTAGEHTDIWIELAKDFSQIKRFRGDQEWIWYMCRDRMQFYPDTWIRSYKWEIRSRNELIGRREETRFRTVCNPEIPRETSVLAFHGNPSLEVVQDPVIVNNWQ